MTNPVTRFFSQNGSYLKVVNSIHARVLRWSGGRVGWTATGVPIVKLTTTGRKSGLPRTVLVMSPVQEGPVFVLVASLGGAPNHPAWFLNLRDNPEVELEAKRHPRAKMRARIATPEERERLWPLAVEQFPKYGIFQERTTRELPVVLVEPR